MTRTRRLAAAYIALAAAVAVLFALNLFWGSVSLAPGAVLTALLGKGGDALVGTSSCSGAGPARTWRRCGGQPSAAPPGPRGAGAAAG